MTIEPWNAILLDGFGNFTLYIRERDSPSIVFKDRSFEKTAEFAEGLEVYRLIGYPPVAVRHPLLLALLLQPPAAR